MSNDISRQDVRESERILQRANENHVTLRLVGGLAIREHCSEIAFCERRYADIDVVGLSNQFTQIVKTFEELGYIEKQSMTISTGGTRLLFEKPGSDDHVDVFLDNIDIEHMIDLRNRLTIEERTISVSDLLLVKLAISRLNEKDFRDMFTLLKDLKVGHDDTAGTINIDYIAMLCSRNWGLYHDIMMNIDRCLDFITQYNFQPNEQERILDTLEQMKTKVLLHPKTTRWKIRALFGERLAWRREIELEGVKAIPIEKDGGLDES
ncbi:MAG: hypothetical protein ACW99H_00775 [Candidatus Thorarchaeota archaeon]|jgi:hypothetical protein